ncbi:preprotein translocase subunit SecE [Rubinisphaera sp. JC750]|uniref:preprotein translocase subunit SecE n=1 Tax=Rubinisphaera sp. JC750 TaxID=2898658 RepID=UPI001F022334|nr:preprotein translocase subunit SecE [Rubinisphaera sp. JC750]
MAKSKASSGLLSELFSVGLYKRSQGQRVRQITGIAIAIIFLVGAWSLSVNVLGNASEPLRVGLPTAIAVLGCWLAYRIVNYPPAADFMIGVQSEMDKVSWPTWPQLWRATVVVLVVMVVLAASLFLFDIIWRFVFTKVGFLRM